MSSGSFWGGFACGVVGCAVVAVLHGSDREHEIATQAKQYAKSHQALNEVFKATGKGLVGVTINGYACVIDVERGLEAPDLSFWACVRPEGADKAPVRVEDAAPK